MSYGAINTIAQKSQTAAPDIGPQSNANGDTQKDLSKWSKIRKNLNAFYNRNFGLCLVFLAQTCGSLMNTTAKLLANDPTVKFHALQIIFIRMLCTTVLGSAYQWYHGVPYFPFGQKDIRGLLMLRGMAGFTGLFGLYYSLSWLELADATVITFIVPTLTAFVCFVWLREPFTIKEASAGIVAFSGVLFVARPTWLVPGPAVDPISGEPQLHTLSSLVLGIHKGNAPALHASPQQHTLAILAAVMGSFGASTAYATIRVIGKRAHSLISVNYFAGIATIGSAVIILIHPELHFVMPKGPTQWALIAVIGLTGFLLQFLLTEGLQREKAGRATNLTYLQLVFALIIEKLIWGTTPPIESLFGATLIIGAAVWVSLQENAPLTEHQKAEEVDEESSLMGNSGGTEREER